ncbi:MAG: hypothetical protein IJX15_02345, partial [Ruminiclostridium sp.]|nr:hypothetical protein [Ruminiclostridium sp.]
TNDGDIYMCDIDGERTRIKAELDFRDSDYYVNDYSNLYGRIMGNSYNHSFLFSNRDFITYTNNGNLYKIDSNGKTSLLLENVE